MGSKTVKTALVVGAIAVGFAAEYNISGADSLGILVGGNGALLLKQCVAVVVSVAWTACFTWLLMRFMRRFVGIDVSPEAEEKGLDFVQIGEQAYDETLAPILDLGVEVLTTKLIDAARAGNLPRVKALIQAGAPPESADYDGRSAMHLAAASGLCCSPTRKMERPEERPTRPSGVRTTSLRWRRTSAAVLQGGGALTSEARMGSAPMPRPTAPCSRGWSP